MKNMHICTLRVIRDKLQHQLDQFEDDDKILFIWENDGMTISITPSNILDLPDPVIP